MLYDLLGFSSRIISFLDWENSNPKSYRTREYQDQKYAQIV